MYGTLKNKPEVFLLAHPSPILRYKVLRNLFNKEETDKEIKELRLLVKDDPLVKELVSLQNNDGSWTELHHTDIPSSSSVIITSVALARLGYLGYTRKDKIVQKAALYLFSKQKKDGSWPLHIFEDYETRKESYSWIPLQTALPLRGLIACGFAQDQRCEKAVQWLMNRRLDDGTWPTGWASNNYGGVAGYRKMPHSRWGCRSNTTAVLICLSLHQKMRKSDEAKKALDLLLGRETKDVQNIGFDLARMLGYEPIRGFLTYYGKYDPMLTLWLCAQVGADQEDDRVRELINFLETQRTASGLWRYHQPEASKWISFEIIHCLEKIPVKGDWQPQEPRTPFQAYPKKYKRY
jgi:hypothetical protein